LRWWPLAVLVAAFGTPFFFVDRGPTTSDFISEGSVQIPLWLYASTYMAGVAGMCLNLIVGVRGRRGNAYWFLIAGGAMVAIGSLIEIVFLTLACFALGTAELRDVAHGLFDPLFYPGVVLIAVGIGTFSTQRSIRERKVRRQISSLEALVAGRRLELPTRPTLRMDRQGADVALERLYDLVIAVHDYDQAGLLALDPEDRLQLSIADKIIAGQLLENPGSANVPLRRPRSRENAQ
jgi:hypothetical protein